MFEYIWILLPIGLLIGWFAAKKDIAKKQRILHYLNLRYLLEDQTQKDYENLALEMPLDSDVEALKFSLLLGDAFRKRGEIDKAINLHEYLIKEAPTKALTEKVYLSLAEDYLAAGMLDRAESTLRQLLESEEYRDLALLKLTKIYKQQREWLQSIAMLEQMESLTPLLRAEMAHLYCELAEEALAEGSSAGLERMMLWLDKAYKADKNCVRATLIRAYGLYQYQQYSFALETLLEIERQEIKLVPLIVPIIYEIYHLENEDELFLQWLEQIISKNNHILLKVWKTHYLILHRSFDAGIDYLQAALKQTPNLLGLTILNQLQKYQNRSEEAELIDQTFQEMLDRYAQFQCDSCGYTTKTLQWSCPSCFEWNRSMPVEDIVALKVKHH